MPSTKLVVLDNKLPAVLEVYHFIFVPVKFKFAIVPEFTKICGDKPVGGGVVFTVIVIVVLVAHWPAVGVNV